MDLNNQAVDVGISATVKVDIPESWANAADTPVAEPRTPQPLSRTSCCLWTPAGRQAACLRVQEARRAGRHLGERHFRLLQAGRGHQGAQVESRELHPVQPLRHVLPPRRHPARAAGRGGEGPGAASFETVPAKGLGKDAPSYFFRMQVSPYDCLGCGVCLTACPANQSDKTADAW